MRAGFFQGSLITGFCVLLSGCGDPFVASGGSGGTTTTTATGAGGTGGATGGSGGQTTTGPACTPLKKGDPCHECLVQECSETYCKCTGIADCIDLASCEASAEVDPGLQVCLTGHKDQISLVGQIQACGSQSCPACDFLPVDKCVACGYVKCPGQTNDCLGNPECVQLGKCIQGCQGDSSCLTNCNMLHQGGYQDFQLLHDCVAALCSDNCG